MVISQMHAAPAARCRSHLPGARILLFFSSFFFLSLSLSISRTHPLSTSQYHHLSQCRGPSPPHLGTFCRPAPPFLYWFLESLSLSGPVLRDTAGLSQRYPPIARYGVFGVSTWPIGCDTPSLFSERFPLWEYAKWRCDTLPLKRGISAILARYPMKTRQLGAIPPSAILSRKGIARYGGVSRTGPLRSLRLPSGEQLSLRNSFRRISRKQKWFPRGHPRKALVFGTFLPPALP